MALIREGAQSPRKIITGFADFWRSSQFFGRQRQTVKIGYGLLLASQGQSNYKIPQELGLDVNKVGRWRNRFVASGFAGLEKDRP